MRAMLMIAMLAAAGCSRDPQAPVKVAIIAPASESRAMDDALVVAATSDGLVAFDEQGQVIPALADRWIVTDDGRSFIFRLREGIWPGGTPIDGKSAAATLRRTIANLKDTALSRDLAPIEEIRAMAGRVVEVRLTHPVPELLQILAMPELALRHGRKAEGPMKPTGSGKRLTLALVDPERRGQAAIDHWASRTRPVVVTLEAAREAVDAFEKGDRDAVFGGRIDTLPLADVGLGRGTLKLDNVTGLFGLMAENDRGALATPELREAIAMAIDREALITPFGIGGWKVAEDIFPVVPGEARSPRWSGLTMAARRETASARFARLRAAGGTIPPLRIALPTGPGSDILFSRFRDDLATIGLSVSRVGASEQADLRFVDEVSRSPSQMWFFNRFACGVRRICSAEGDERLAAALASMDPAERTTKLAEAQDLISAANGFIALAQPVRWSLVRGSLTGFSANSIGWHPLPPLALLPR